MTLRGYLVTPYRVIPLEAVRQFFTQTVILRNIKGSLGIRPIACNDHLPLFVLGDGEEGRFVLLAYQIQFQHHI